MSTSAIRMQQEEAERCLLSPFAALSAESKGRIREEEKCPIRTEYQRDRDRIIHSKAFRRLKHKTQVFIDPEEDHYRTRLTHTLEVSQISRTVSRALHLNEDLTEAIALGHDLGHTPFGHAGESALDAAYKEYLPSAGFHHNEQSLRVVDFLERDGQGLNLTWEVRDGILHHSKGVSDLRLGESGSAATLEGRVMRICDRIAYINHDIDDAIRAGIITEADLPKECTDILGNRHSQRISAMVIDLVENSKDTDDISLSQEIVEATNGLKDFLFNNVYVPGPRMDELNRAARLISELFRLYMEDPIFIPEWLRPVNGNVETRARAVCDYIAGMTDRYAQRQYTLHYMPGAAEYLNQP
ncbi:MAG: deoxyguanosinetriphosphate triphosphohydrolase [Armatimonadota bacterium]